MLMLCIFFLLINYILISVYCSLKNLLYDKFLIKMGYGMNQKIAITKYL
jgi:hypothetical protein